MRTTLQLATSLLRELGDHEHTWEGYKRRRHDATALLNALFARVGATDTAALIAQMLEDADTGEVWDGPSAAHLVRTLMPTGEDTTDLPPATTPPPAMTSRTLAALHTGPLAVVLSLTRRRRP